MNGITIQNCLAASGFMDNSFIGPVLWGMFGLFILSLALGVLWGTLRGGKRTLLRLGTLILFIVLAFLLTPVVTGALTGIKLPFLNNMPVGEYLESQIASQNMGAAALDNLPAFTSLVKNMPIALLNLIVYFAMFIIFWILSYIAFIILSKFFAPNKKKVKKEDGTIIKEKVKKNRWIGLGLGVLQGFVIFFFFWIPVNGLLGAMDSVDNYNPKYAAVNVMEDGIGPSAEIFRTLNDVNGGIQKSAYGYVTKYTGLQAISGGMLNYLTKVNTKVGSVSIVSDIVTAGKLGKDAAALAVTVQESPDDIVTVLETFDYYKDVKSIIDKLFNIKIVKVSLNSMPAVADFIGDTTLLNSIKLFNDINKDKEFRDAIVSALKKVTADTLRQDLKTTVDLIEAVFAKPKDKNGDRLNSFYSAFKNVVNNTKNTALLGSFGDDLAGLMEIQMDNNGTNNIDRITSKFFDLNLIKKSIGDGESDALFKLPLMHYLGLTETESDLFAEAPLIRDKTFWYGVGTDTGNLLIKVARTIGPIMEIVNGGGDMLSVLRSIDINAIGDLLEELTNKLGIRKTIRAAVAEQFDKINIPAANAGDVIDLQNIFATIRTLLEGDEPIMWVQELGSIRTLAQLWLGISDLGGTMGIDDILELLQTAGDSPIVSGIVVDVLIGTMNNNFENEFNIDITNADPQQLLDVLQGAAGGFAAFINGEITGTDLNGEGGGTLLDLFGGEEGGVGTLEALADLGVVINIESGNMGEAAGALIEMIAPSGDPETNELRNKLLTLFGLV